MFMAAFSFSPFPQHADDQPDDAEITIKRR
jgi:hypothetical protein